MKSITLDIRNGEIYIVTPDQKLVQRGKKVVSEPVGSPGSLLFNKRYKFKGKIKK